MRTLNVNGEDKTVRPIQIKRTAELSSEFTGRAWLTEDDAIVFTHLVPVEKTEPVTDAKGGALIDEHGHAVTEPVVDPETGKPEIERERLEVTHVFPAGSPNRDALEFEFLG